MQDLSLIPLKNNLLIDATYNKVKNVNIHRINELGLQDPKYKNDNEFLTLVCSLIENLVSKKDKISKQDLAVEIFHLLFNLDEDEKIIVRKNIDFLCNQKTIVKKLSWYKLFRAGICEWFFKKR